MTRSRHGCNGNRRWLNWKFRNQTGQKVRRVTSDNGTSRQSFTPEESTTHHSPLSSIKPIKKFQRNNLSATCPKRHDSLYKKSESKKNRKDPNLSKRDIKVTSSQKEALTVNPMPMTLMMRSSTNSTKESSSPWKISEKKWVWKRSKLADSPLLYWSQRRKTVSKRNLRSNWSPVSETKCKSSTLTWLKRARTSHWNPSERTSGFRK